MKNKSDELELDISWDDDRDYKGDRVHLLVFWFDAIDVDNVLNNIYILSVL